MFWLYARFDLLLLLFAWALTPGAKSVTLE